MEFIKDNLFDNHYTAPDGYLIARKDDESITTDSIWLGATDSIENYEIIEKPKEIEDGKSSI